MAGLSLRLGLGLQRPAAGGGAAAVAPTNTVLPAISGNRWVGETLSVSNGTWNDGGSAITSYAYQWKRGGANISGATASTYQLVSGDAGQNITCTVTATNAVGSTPATSAASAICADELWANVRLLLGFDGVDGATSTTDASNSAHSITFNGGANLDTGEKKFGTASLQLDGTGDYLSIAHSSDFIFDADFTIEGFAYRAGGTSTRFIITKDNSTGGNRSFRIQYESTNKFQAILSTIGSADSLTLTGTTTIATGAWHHFCLERSGNTVRLYVDGVMEASGTLAGSLFNNSTVDLLIGRRTNVTTNDMNGQLDEVRITKGAARYASDSGFTVPAAAYPRP